MYALKYGKPTHVRVENYVNSFKKMEIKVVLFYKKKIVLY